MFYPVGPSQALIVLLCGLLCGGLWPAVRQMVKRVDFVTFNLGFIPAMSISGLVVLSLLSLPRPRSPPPRPYGPGDYPGLMDAFGDESTHKNSHALALATLAGACVATSNFMLSGAMSYAGLTRSLPVFNGMAILVGVSVNFTIEGNRNPASLAAGVLCIFMAIFLTFLSRQQTASSDHDAGAAAAALATSRPLAAHSRELGKVTKLLSFDKLEHVVENYEQAQTTLAAQGQDQGEGQELAERGANLHSGYDAVDNPALAEGRASGTAAAEIATRNAEEPRRVLLGLIMSTVAGSVDGCWSSLTLKANILGVDNYVTAAYFCFGLLVPWVAIEIAMYLRDPATFKANCRRVTACEWSLVCLAGFLNIFAIVTYFMATVVISSAVAFAIFLSTPLVSISFGVFVVRELDDEPPSKKLLVAAIMGLYVAAISTLALNALIPSADQGSVGN